jgi:hypothetical protein
LWQLKRRKIMTKKLWKLLFAAALTTAALLSMPPQAMASVVECNLCDQYHTCFDCCRCDGHGSVYCTKNCP